MELFAIEDKNGIKTVRINNPKKKNALNKKAYMALATILNEAGADNKVKCVVITGVGDFFSSGNDLTAIMNMDAPPEGTSIHLPLISMVQAFIRFPKLLVAIVNGPAIGIAATVIALCDIIYAAENAYFLTPFTNLGLCAEGCSSLTFPKILGTSKANEMLMLNHKMSAQEAHAFGFVACVYKDEREIWARLDQISHLPIGSIKANKRLIRKFTVEELEQANLSENDELDERFSSEEALQALLRFQEVRRNRSKL